MALNPILKDMLGDQLWTALDEAQTRLAGDTVNARCAEALWIIERAGVAIHTDLTYEACVTQLNALT